MPRYRKKTVVIDAVQWDGTAEGAGPIINWVLGCDGNATYRDDMIGTDGVVCARLAVVTLEGPMFYGPGWWIIRGALGEFYACSPEVFEATYEAVEDDEETA